MSSCVIIAQKNNLYIGADSACSIKTECGFERYHNDMQKLFRFGNQVLFCSGKAVDVYDCIKWISINMPNGIDIDVLSSYLKNRFKNVFYDKYFNIEMLIVDYDAKCIYQLSQYNNFEILKYKSTEQLLVLCGGYKTPDFFEKIRKNILSNKSVIDIYVDTYKDMCDECVGGYITIYSSPNNFEKHRVDYFGENIIQNKNSLFLVSADFVTAGIVSGSQIIGGNIYSDNYSITKRTGSYINLRDGTFSFGGGALQFNDGKLTISSNTADTNITELNDEWLKTTSVYAQNLNVNSANVNGELTAATIKAENITGTTLTGKTINGGQLLIGNKNDTYAEITSDGVLNCKGANITGEIYATSGEIGGIQIIDGELQISSLTEDDVEEITGTYINEWRVSSPVLEGAEIYGGLFYATGQGADDGAAYYIYDSGTYDRKGNYVLGNLVGYISYDTNGSGDTDDDGNVIDAEKRVIFNTEGIPLKINSGNNMSLEANGTIYMISPTFFGDTITLATSSFGKTLPSSGQYGQLFFKLA